MSSPFEPTPRLPELGKTSEEKARLILAYAKQQYQRLAEMQGSHVAASDFGNIGFYLATKVGLQKTDPLIINDRVIMRYLSSLGDRELRYIELTREADSYELDVNAEVYDTATIKEQTIDGVPQELMLICLRETSSGITLGDMPLDLAVNLDLVGESFRLQEGDTYVDNLLKIMQLVEIAPYTNK